MQYAIYIFLDILHNQLSSRQVNTYQSFYGGLGIVTRHILCKRETLRRFIQLPGLLQDLNCPIEPNNSFNSLLGASNGIFQTKSFVLLSPLFSACAVSILFFVVTISERAEMLKFSTKTPCSLPLTC